MSRPTTPTIFGGLRTGDTIRRSFIRATDTGLDRESTWDFASAAGAAGVLEAGVGAGARIGSAAAYSSTTPSSIAMDITTVTGSAADWGEPHGCTIPGTGLEWPIRTAG